MTVCLIDTSILCEIPDVPFMASDRARVMAELKQKIVAREQLVLPMTAILETGNHIGQNGNGTQRRQTAGRYALVARVLERAMPRRRGRPCRTYGLSSS